jgi:hypothetical protein
MANFVANQHNVNPLSASGFTFNIQKIPELTYFAQEVTLPSVSLPPVEIQSPLSTFYQSGVNLQYSDLTVSFIVNEDMSNYLAIYKWMVGLGFPEARIQFSEFINGSNLNEVSDGNLQILSSSNNVIQNITFYDLRPIELGGLTMVTNQSDITYLTCDVTFNYSFFKFEGL